MESPSHPKTTPQQLADISALADGSIAPERRPDVERMVAAAPELRELLALERRAVDALTEARERDRAPLRLRLQIETARPSARVRRVRKARYGGAFAGALATVALVLALALPGGTPGGPSLAAAASLALRGPVAAAPGHSADDPPRTIDAQVGNLYFPNFAHAVGMRKDRIDGHTAITVYYEPRGQEIAYTILTTPPLTVAGHGQNVRGTLLHELTLHGRSVVTWTKRGHTCIVSSTTVSTSGLAEYAAAEGNH